jgi:predicted transcriptional regulator
MLNHVNLHQAYWDRADYCLSLSQNGKTTASIVEETGYSDTLVRSSIKAAETFSEKYRTPELICFETYCKLARLSAPIAVLKFCLEYRLRTDEINRLYDYLKRNPFCSNLEKAAEKAGVGLESPKAFIWGVPINRKLSAHEKARHRRKQSIPAGQDTQETQETKLKHQSYWEKADYCLIKRKSRTRIEVATLIGRCPSIVDSYVKSAKTFPAEYRIPELSSFRSYEYLSRLSNPITVLEFCLSYNLSSSELYSLYRFLKENPEEEKNLAKAAKRVGIKLGQPRTVIWGKSFDDASEITTENQVGQERPVNEYNTVNDLLAAMEENPEDYYVDLRIFNNKDLSAPIVDINNFPELKTGRPPIPIPHQQFMGYYRKGLVDQDIAELLDTSRSTVLRYRQELGLPANREIGVRGPAKAKEILTRIPTMIDSLRKENESLKKENQSLEEENQFLRDQITKLLAEQADLGPIQELQEIIETLQAENESLAKEIKRTKRLTETYLKELQRRTTLYKRVG